MRVELAPVHDRRHSYLPYVLQCSNISSNAKVDKPKGTHNSLILYHGCGTFGSGAIFDAEDKCQQQRTC